MNTRVYRNTDANVPSINEFSTTNPHPLQLFPEDRIVIHDVFLRHLAHCNLTPRRVRIVLAVFNQTLGFNKLEDDMNGTRLQQLTGISANHANSTVRELEQLNVLVTRRGQYGHFLALNFNLEQWGQHDKQLQPTTDPCFLLPEDELSDTGLDLSSAINTDNTDNTDNETETKTEMENISDSLDVPINVHNEKTVQPQSQPAEQTTIDTEIINELLNAIKTLSDKVVELEQKIENFPTHQPHLPQETLTATTVPTPKTAASTLRYPRVFNPQQCQQASTIIQRVNDADKAQLLLDMLEKRINHQHDPLRSPMRYLETLVTKLNNNQLTITPEQSQQTTSTAFVSTTTSITGEATREPSEAERIQAEYQEASLDCMHMKRNITMLAEKDNISFEESLSNLHLQEWWEDIKARFYTAKEAMASLSNEQAQAMVV